MKITFKQNPDDPLWPIMHGDTPAAKEFNRRQKEIWKTGNFGVFDFEQVATVILEMVIEDYNNRHKPRKKKKTNA